MLARDKKVLEKLHWPGGEWDSASREDGKALLAGGHVKSISFFLIQHKEQFGVMEIKSLKVWQEMEPDYGEWQIMLTVRIGPVVGLGGVVRKRDSMVDFAQG